MIKLHRLHAASSGEQATIVVNADLIETIEACPDTVIQLVTKRRFVVSDSVEDVIDRVIEFRRQSAAVPGATGARAMNVTTDREKAA